MSQSYILSMEIQSSSDRLNKEYLSALRRDFFRRIKMKPELKAFLLATYRLMVQMWI